MICNFVRVFFMVLDLRFVKAVVKHPSLCFYFLPIFRCSNSSFSNFSTFSLCVRV